VQQTLDDYTYDEHGNMLTMPHLQSMAWNYKDQLSQVELSTQGDTAYYIYDNTGNRVRKIIEKGNIREERYYQGGYEVFRKFVSGDLDFERQTLHIDDDKKKVALIETKTVENGTTLTTPEITARFQYDNHLGTACIELDEDAEIISYEEYHPFGTTSYRSGRTETEVSLKRYKYIGKERDEESGFYYYGARYYSAWLCRFISVDPLQHKYPHYTPFQYAGNKPISYIDLDGLEEKKYNEVTDRDIKLNLNPTAQEAPKPLPQSTREDPISKMPTLGFPSPAPADATNFVNMYRKIDTKRLPAIKGPLTRLYEKGAGSNGRDLVTFVLTGKIIHFFRK
jgi:RHS repeat-associated protein